jgi:hypothetical protein
MALVLADRVKETTTTTGTGTVTLLGAATGFQSFAAVGNANTTYYCIAGQTTNEWEVGIGTYTSSGTTLARTTVLASSNSGSLVTFSAGTKDVFVTYPSSRSVYADGTTLTATNSSILPATSGGTGASSYAVGDMLYGNTTTTLDKVAPNTTGTRKFLRQTGTGSAGTAPVWDTLVSGDIPANAANTSGTAAVASAVTNTGAVTAAASYFPAFLSANTSSNQALNTATAFTFNPSTGALSATSHVSSSDERKKTNWRDLPEDFIEQLASVKNGIYDRVEGGNTEVGVSGQSLQAILEQGVIADEEGFLSVMYGNVALVACIKLAERVLELEAKLKDKQ